MIEYNDKAVFRKYLILLNYFYIAWLLFFAVPAQAQPRAAAVTIYAAASLKNALDVQLNTTHAQTRFPAKVVYAASSTLARQIEHGAPADLFIAADLEWMDYLQQRKLLRTGSRVNLLTNRLVLIAPAQRSSNLVIGPNFPLAAALGKERLAMADIHSVPAGKYGRAALQALGVWQQVERSIAPAENVRAALLLVARGETPFGIVYASDAAMEPRVRVQGEFPPDTHPLIVYPAAVLAASRAADAAPLLDHLRSAEARALWRQHGFGVAN